VPFPPGSATDSMMRAMAPVLSKSLGQHVIVDNRPGAGGTMAAAFMAQSRQNDGYQLAVAPITLFMVPHMQKVPYDPMKDLTYVVGFAAYTYGLVVPGDSPVKTLDQFVASAKAAPQPITVANTGAGSPGHTATVLLAQKMGIKLEAIPYKGGAEMVPAFKGGHVQSVLDGGWAAAVRQAGGRALITFTDKRMAPDVPTAREAGIDLVIESPIGLVGPKGMDPKVVEKIQNAVQGAMGDANLKKAMATFDVTDNYLSSADYRKVAERLWVSERKNLEMFGLIGDK
jgi:tripartite-type tricarboxylate transporter receptor subunit TctC